MPRGARIVLVDSALHIVQRGINRGPCFFTDADYAAYLSYLGEFAEEFGCLVHAYCLMSNHVHLLVTPRRADGVALLMKQLGQCYVQRVNKKLGRTGTLWEGRFHSCLVRSDRYALACYRYIDLNPVRAAMVDQPARYSWSSYGLNASGEARGMLTAHPAYLALGSDGTQRSRAYQQLCQDPLPMTELEDIRKATSVGCVVGTIRKRKGRPSEQMRKIGSVPN